MSNNYARNTLRGP